MNNEVWLQKPFSKAHSERQHIRNVPDVENVQSAQNVENLGCSVCGEFGMPGFSTFNVSERSAHISRIAIPEYHGQSPIGWICFGSRK